MEAEAKDLIISLFTIVLTTLFFIVIIIVIVKSIVNAGQNTPTWTGIIISALLGMLVFYLVLCFFGWMGEKRNNYS